MSFDNNPLFPSLAQGNLCQDLTDSRPHVSRQDTPFLILSTQGCCIVISSELKQAFLERQVRVMCITRHGLQGVRSVTAILSKAIPDALLLIGLCIVQTTPECGFLEQPAADIAA